jgi:hypothetical protein
VATGKRGWHEAQGIGKKEFSLTPKRRRKNKALQLTARQHASQVTSVLQLEC